MRKFEGARGFSFLELTVVVAIVVALAAVVIPMVNEAQRDSDLARVFETIERTRSAVVEFHRDTARCAVERDGRSELTQPTSYTGWKGPYLELSPEANPHRGSVSIHGVLAESLFGGFDLLGLGHVEPAEFGNFVRLGNIPEALARAVDETLDRGLIGPWERTGRVVWRQGRLDVFLFAAHELGAARPLDAPR